jgi:hypothetical protein
MKSKRRLKKYFWFLKKHREEICFELELDYKEVKRDLREANEVEMEFRDAVKIVKLRKKFRKALAIELNVKYSRIKHRFPLDFNSTSIANYLDPYLGKHSHAEIRDACQRIKLRFGVNF